MKLSETLQKFLPFGYLFLVVLGILKQSVFYYQMGINVLNYSNLMDILISPIADLTSNPIILFSCIAFLFLLFLITLFLSKNHKKEWVKKLMRSQRNLSDLTENEVEIHFGKLFIVMFAIGLLAFFLGIGIGRGKAVSDKIAQNKLDYPYSLTFTTNETKEVYLIGNNSSNYFYVEKGSKHVRISPVGSIQTLELIKNKKLDKK